MGKLNHDLLLQDRVEANKPAVILVNGKYYKPEEKDHLYLVQSLIFQLDEALREYVDCLYLFLITAHGFIRDFLGPQKLNIESKMKLFELNS